MKSLKIKVMILEVVFLLIIIKKVNSQSLSIKIDICNSYLSSFPRVYSPVQSNNLIYLNRYGTIRVNPYLIPRDYNTHKRLGFLGKDERRYDTEIEVLKSSRKEDIELKFLDKYETKGFLEPIKRESLSKLNIK